MFFLKISLHNFKKLQKKIVFRDEIVIIFLLNCLQTWISKLKMGKSKKGGKTAEVDETRWVHCNTITNFVTSILNYCRVVKTSSYIKLSPASRFPIKTTLFLLATTSNKPPIFRMMSPRTRSRKRLKKSRRNLKIRRNQRVRMMLMRRMKMMTVARRLH